MTELWGTPTSRDLVEVNGLAKVLIWKHSSMVLWKPQEKIKFFCSRRAWSMSQTLVRFNKI